MDKFCQVVFKIAEISSSAEKDVIQQHLTDFTSNFHTPNHPPYAAMIEKAITELNEKTGSSEESISNYVIMEYKDLPWAHSTILKHHLSKLCEFGEISVTCKGRYIIGVPKPKRENINRKLKSKSKSTRGRSRNKKEINIDETFQDERVVMREKKSEEKNYTLETPNVAIGEENEVTLNINEQENVVIDLTSLLVTSKKLEQVKIENVQESDTKFTATRKVNLDLHEKEEDGDYQSSEIKLNPKPEDGKKLEIESERTDLENVGLTEELNLAPELRNAAIEKDAELEYEPVNRLNHNIPQSESRLTKARTLCLNLDLHEKDEDEMHPDLEAELNPNLEYGKKLECDCEITDLVKVGLAEEQNLAPELLNVAIVEENEDDELESESENRLNHNLRQSNSNITTARTLFMNLDSREKEEDEKHPNSEAELNSKPEDGKKLEIDSERDLVKVGLAKEQYLTPLLPNVAMEKENEDVEVESEAENRLNHNLLQSESSVKAASTRVKLDSHAREEDEKRPIPEAELNPKPEYGKKLETDCERTDLVKVGLAEEHNLAPTLLNVEMAKENEDVEVEVDSEPENRLNHNIPQSESSLKTARTLCVSLDSHEKEDKKRLNSKAELNPKLDGKKLENYGNNPEGQEPEKDGEKPGNFSEKPEKDVEKPESDGEKPDLTLNSEHINEEDESKSEKDDIKPKKDDEKTNLTRSSDHVEEEDESTKSIKDGGKPEKHGRTPEKHSEKIDLTLNSEDIDEEEESNISDDKTDRQQRQLKRWRQRQLKVKPEQIPMKNKDILDEEKCQQQKQESGIRQQPKRQLRSQSQSQTSETLVNHVHISTPKKSTVLKRAKINTESQTRRFTRSAAAKSAENKISEQIPLQRTKLRSWHKRNNSESNMEWSIESSSAPANRQHSFCQSCLKRGKR